MYICVRVFFVRVRSAVCVRARVRAPCVDGQYTVTDTQIQTQTQRQTQTQTQLLTLKLSDAPTYRHPTPTHPHSKTHTHTHSKTHTHTHTHTHLVDNAGEVVEDVDVLADVVLHLCHLRELLHYPL